MNYKKTTKSKSLNDYFRDFNFLPQCKVPMEVKTAWSEMQKTADEDFNDEIVDFTFMQFDYFSEQPDLMASMPDNVDGYFKLISNMKDYSKIYKSPVNNISLKQYNSCMKILESFENELIKVSYGTLDRIN